VELNQDEAMDNYHSLIQALRTIGALIQLLECTKMEILHDIHFINMIHV
jgi:hypothetical protein